MQKRKGIVYPRIEEEIINYAELQEVWDCGYLKAYRILHGLTAPNHKIKEQLSEYLGIPVAELWVKADDAPEDKAVAQTDTPTENSEIISEFISSEV